LKIIEKSAQGTGSAGKFPKAYRDALRAAIADADNAPDDDPRARRRLRHIAQQHLDLCARGDLGAIVQLRDTLDGKPAQSFGQDEELGPLIVNADRRR
jgi:hypothetical protein